QGLKTVRVDGGNRASFKADSQIAEQFDPYGADVGSVRRVGPSHISQLDVKAVVNCPGDCVSRPLNPRPNRARLSVAAEPSRTPGTLKRIAPGVSSGMKPTNFEPAGSLRLTVLFKGEPSRAMR